MYQSQNKHSYTTLKELHNMLLFLDSLEKQQYFTNTESGIIFFFSMLYFCWDNVGVPG